MTVENCIVKASYHEYMIEDYEDETDYAKAPEGGDGVLAPGRTGTAVITGTPWGPVRLAIHLDEPLPPLEDLGVAARCSLFLPTGRLLISNPDNDIVWETQVAPGYCTVLVAVHNRDRASDKPVQHEVVEHHEVFLIPGTEELLRWRSAHRDMISQ